MSASAERNEIEELLPFYVNGTLSKPERDLVEEALADDDRLEADKAWVSALRNEVRADSEIRSPGAFGLARLMRDVEKVSPAVAATRSRPSPVLWGALAASVVAVAFVLSGILGVDAPGYEQASGAPVGESVGVIFNSDVDAGTLSAAVYDLGLVVVDGPSALGVYQVAPVEGGDLASLAEMLASRHELFEYVETVD